MTQSPARPTPVIRGALVYLRAAERDDLPLFVRWLSDGETLHTLALRSPLSMPLEEKWFERMLERQGHDSYHFVICRLEDDLPIGTVGFHDIFWEDGAANLGISIGEKAMWDHGYGTDATNAIVDFGFGSLRLERIELDVYAYNERGRRAYEKAGFVHEGTLRRAHFERGQRHDVHRMAILRDEWAALARPKSWDYEATPSATRTSAPKRSR
jgi:RimJ/RimL family protein N-acetyltransferase